MRTNRMWRLSRLRHWLLSSPTAEPALARVRGSSPPLALRRWRLVAAFTMLAVVYGAEAVARALLPLLLRDHPLMLVALDSSTHDVLLAGLKLPVAELFAVAVAWRCVVHVVYYLLGLWYGEAVLSWLGNRSSLSAFILGKVEVVFCRVAKLAVFLFAGSVVCVLAGATRMRPLPFALLQLAGTALHIYALVLVIQHAHGPLAAVVTFVDSDVSLLTLIFVIATVVAIAISAIVHRSLIRDFATAWRASRQSPESTADDPPDNNQDVQDAGLN